MIEFRTILAALFFLAGALSIGISVFGVFRFRFVLNRMHSAAIIDTLGLSLILLGLLIAAWDMSYSLKLVLILVFQWIGSPIASHMVGRLETDTDPNLKAHLREEEPDGLH